MAEVKIIYIDGTDGFPTEMDPTADSITVAQLTMNGNIVMGSNKITGLADGTASGDAVTFNQFQAAIDGLDYKDSVRAATVSTDLGATFAAGGGAAGKGQFTLAPATLDGITLADGDRVLVKNQTAGLENGIYLVMTPTTTWDRATDFDDSAEVTDGATVWVGEGTAQADSRWTVSTNDAITVNTTAIAFVQTAGASLYTGGDGIDITGTTISVDLSATPGLEFSTGTLQVLVDPAGAILRQAAGIGVNVGNGIEIVTNALAIDLAATDPCLSITSGLDVLVNAAGALSKTATGLQVVVDGSTIQINGSNQLEVIGAGDANRISNSYTAQVNVTLGDPLAATTTNNEVAKANAADATARKFVGLAKTTATATNPVDVVCDGLASGVLTAGTYVAGDPVYVASGGGLTKTRPATTGDHVLYLGRAMNADDLLLQPQYFGKVS